MAALQLTEAQWLVGLAIVTALVLHCMILSALIDLKIFGRSLGGSELSALYSAFLQERPSFPTRSFPWLAALPVLAAGLLAVYLLRRLRRHQPHHDPSQNAC